MKKIPTIEIREKVVFEFGYFENAERVAMALSLGGYYVRIKEEQGKYTVFVYTDRDL